MPQLRKDERESGETWLVQLVRSRTDYCAGVPSIVRSRPTSINEARGLLLLWEITLQDGLRFGCTGTAVAHACLVVALH